MYPDVRPVVTFRYQHDCGNILSETYYFSEATFTVRIEATTFTPRNQPLHEGKGKLDGIIETVELGGIGFSKKDLTCARCGQSVVFPDRRELSNPG